MPLLEQSVTVKTINGKIMVKYECDGEVYAFILTRDAAMQLSGMLENAVRSVNAYSVGISI